MEDLRDRIHTFERHYEAVAQPFEWKFTRHDLAALVGKLADRRAA